MQVFIEILELIGKCNETTLNCSFALLQFQGLGKYETLYVSMTQTVFRNNSRQKKCPSVFLLLFIGSL